ncbi:MAG: hypothetical protein PHO91_01825 [Patescibacteria group bacterium]|nr:hypothetical protein [Patescibacteria group bacterium]
MGSKDNRLKNSNDLGDKLIKIYSHFEDCLNKQRVELKKLNLKNELRYIYVVETFEAINDCISLSHKLNTPKEHVHGLVVIRPAFENLLRLEYFLNQTKEKQNELATKEVLKIAARFYKFTGDEKYKTYYKKFNKEAITSNDIERFDTKDKIFPDIKTLINKTKINIKDLEFIYSNLSEFSHGRLMALVMGKSELQYFSPTPIAHLITIELMKITDNFLNRKTYNYIKTAMEKSSKILSISK